MDVERSIKNNSRSNDNCNSAFIRRRLDFACSLVKTLEDGTNTCDIEKLTKFYKSICVDDFVYVEEYVGSAHPMKDKSNIVTYVGCESLKALQISWAVSMPDLVFRHTKLELEDNGNLIIAHWECTGTKISNVDYSRELSDNKYLSKHVDLRDNVTVSKPSMGVRPNICLFGTLRLYLTDDEKLYKMHYIVNS